MMGILSRIKKKISKSTEPRKTLRPQHERGPVSVVSRTAAPVELEPTHPRDEQDVAEYVDEQLRNNKVVLFMKGSPDAPQCGFSATTCTVLGFYKVDFHHVDILLDVETRSYVKAYSKWPTIPQLYVNREFIGGSDIVMEMHEAGELEPLFSGDQS